MENLEEKLKVIFTEEQIQKRIKEVAKKIDDDYKGKTVIIISVLKGAIFFTVDLVKKMKTPIMLEVMQVSSYQGTQSTGNIIVKKGLDTDIEGKDVLIVEDIIDTGLTARFLTDLFKIKHHPKKLVFTALLNKKCARQIDIEPDFYGFEIDDKFVVGYGLDYKGYFRNLPFIGYFPE